MKQKLSAAYIEGQVIKVAEMMAKSPNPNHTDVTMGQCVAMVLEEEGHLLSDKNRAALIGVTAFLLNKMFDQLDGLPNTKHVMPPGRA